MQLFNNLKLKRSKLWQLFILYCCVLFYVVFLTPNRYKGTEYDMKIVPLWNTIRQGIYKTPGEQYWRYYVEYWANILGNIILFMPFGFLLKWLYSSASGKQILLYGLLVSVSIELLQFFLQIGVCDVDDVLLNVCGVGAGLVVYKWMQPRLGTVLNSN